jgi:polar amino acid transport system substrate-binding protein
MRKLILLVALVLWPGLSTAQDLLIGTVTRLPFSMHEGGRDTGFSIELWDAISRKMGVDYKIRRFDSFNEMLEATNSGQVDAATANISITAERERSLDFTQPIFSAGLQIMIPAKSTSGSGIWQIITSPDVLLAVVMAFALLLGGGMLMWRFERGAEPYFDHPAKKAMFPAFWWALNLVVNGGFEERVPRTALGRILGTVLVVSSLFLVSIFVAKITSKLTVQAITSSVTSINDLYRKQVGTIEGSTAANFLDRRDLNYSGFNDPETMLAAFEAEELDAVVFDAPILAYYANSDNNRAARMAGPVFLREDYGIALPPGSPLAEDINQALLNLREDGSYAKLRHKWFGSDSE